MLTFLFTKLLVRRAIASNVSFVYSLLTPQTFLCPSFGWLIKAWKDDKDTPFLIRVMYK